MLHIRQQGKDVELEEVLPERQQVVFNIRPCDAHGLAAIDALFLRQPADRTYRAHRERTTLVGLACPQMWEGCFCTVGGWCARRCGACGYPAESGERRVCGAGDH